MESMLITYTNSLQHLQEMNFSGGAQAQLLTYGVGSHAVCSAPYCHDSLFGWRKRR